MSEEYVVTLDQSMARYTDIKVEAVSPDDAERKALAQAGRDLDALTWRYEVDGGVEAMEVREASEVEPAAPRPPVAGGADSYVVGPDTTRADVVRKYDLGASLEALAGYDLDPLVCPHCELWIGDPDDAGIAHVSIEHDVGTCGDERVQE